MSQCILIVSLMLGRNKKNLLDLNTIFFVCLSLFPITMPGFLPWILFVAILVSSSLKDFLLHFYFQNILYKEVAYFCFCFGFTITKIDCISMFAMAVGKYILSVSLSLYVSTVFMPAIFFTCLSLSLASQCQDETKRIF